MPEYHAVLGTQGGLLGSWHSSRQCIRLVRREVPADRFVNLTADEVDRFHVSPCADCVVDPDETPEGIEAIRGIAERLGCTIKRATVIYHAARDVMHPPKGQPNG